MKFLVLEGVNGLAEPDVKPLIELPTDGVDWVPSERYIAKWNEWQQKARTDLGNTALQNE
ncbi:MAG: hypothetical protein WC498_00775 [Candidatus Saccharimonadales bacterium]